MRYISLILVLSACSSAPASDHDGTGVAVTDAGTCTPTCEQTADACAGVCGDSASCACGPMPASNDGGTGAPVTDAGTCMPSCEQTADACADVCGDSASCDTSCLQWIHSSCVDYCKEIAE